MPNRRSGVTMNRPPVDLVQIRTNRMIRSRKPTILKATGISARFPVGRRRAPNNQVSSFYPADDFESLGVFAADLHAACDGPTLDELRRRIRSIGLRVVAGDSGELPGEMLFLEEDEALGGDREVIPGHLVSEHSRVLKGTKALVVNRLVILMGIFRRWHEQSVWSDIP